MTRKTCDANLLHLDPLFIRVKANDNCHARGITWTTVNGNELILQKSGDGSGHSDEVFGQAREIWQTAMALGCHRLRFHLAGPVLEYPMFDEAAVVAAFNAGPMHIGGFRTQEAEEAMEELEKDPTFDETPMCYERMALWLCDVLRKRDRFQIDVMKLWRVFEQIMRIGHASAWSKQESHNHWIRCDASFEQLGSDIDEFLASTTDRWDRDVAWLENLAFAAKYALKQSLRATAVPRTDLRPAIEAEQRAATATEDAATIS